MSKYAQAILQLAQTRADVEACSSRIRTALDGCDMQQQRNNGDRDFVVADHLKDAYHMTSDENEDGGSSERYFVNHEGDAGAYLSSVCGYCRKAHDAIQDRKAARKEYGIAKRRVSLMGSAMLKAIKKVTGEKT